MHKAVDDLFTRVFVSYPHAVHLRYLRNTNITQQSLDHATAATSQHHKTTLHITKTITPDDNRTTTNGTTNGTTTERQRYGTTTG